MNKLFFIFLIFCCLVLVSADHVEAKKMYAPDLTITNTNLAKGDITIANIGNKNSPATGFDVLIYFKKKDGTFQKDYYHINKVIAPGYSRKFYKVYPNGEKATTGLLRVNPLKKFQEWSYTNNMRYFNMKTRTITSYSVQEIGRYWGTPYHWRTKDKPRYRYDWAFKFGSTGNFENGDYSPVISTNPIATSWYNQVNKTTVYENIYANGARIFAEFSKATSFTYISVSGVPNDYNLKVGLEFDARDSDYFPYVYNMTYNAAKGIWERYFIDSASAVTIYSTRTGPESTEDYKHCGNIVITVKTMNNVWRWST